MNALLVTMLMTAKLTYPQTKQGDVVETLHGQKVADPYRWLEDPDSAETKAWVEAQNKVSFGLLEKLPARAAFKERLTALWNYERFSPFSVKGKGKERRYFWSKNDGLQNQSVLYVADKLDGEARVLLDPNALSKDGTVALSGSAVSDDGKYFAYSLSSGGSDWQEWHVKEIATGKDLPDVIKWSKFSGAAWTPDGAGFYYARFPEPKKGDALEEQNYFRKLYFHRLGEPQEKDVLVLEDKEHKTWGFEGTVSEDGKYLVVHVWDGTDRRNRLWFREVAAKPDAPFVKLFDKFDAAYGFLGNKGSVFYVQTDLNAPRQRIVTIDVAKKGAPLVDLIPQHATDKLEWAKLIGGGILTNWLHNASDLITFHSLDGKKIRDIALPTLGSSGGFAGKSDETETSYSFTSFTYPTVVYKLDLKTGTSTVFKEPKVQFKPSDYETKQVFFKSKDGVEIPMFIVHKKGIVYDGSNPTLLYGYGGFNVSLTPYFDIKNVAWMEKGGVYAMATLRGGGEFGEAWHEAGMLAKKQNVFDDFAAAAQHLVAMKITTAKKLAIMGGSNGGLLVGASITQHPELFGAAVAAVGVMDMLRFHKFTIGHAWVSDYGSPDDAKMFPVLKAYSPLHNTKQGTAYPATLITTADHDDRVVPAHSFKFAAALQKAQGGDAPVIIRIETKAGHGAGKPTSKQIEESADVWSFLWTSLGMDKAGLTVAPQR